MEAIVAMNASVSFVNGNRLRSPPIQKVCFPGGASRRGTLSCFTTRAALEGDEGSKKSIRLTIQAETPGKSEPAKLVINVPDHDEGKQEDDRESVTHVASESAVEAPERVHEEAEHEAGSIASKTGEAVEKVTGNLKEEAERASDVEAEHLGSENPVAGLGQELQKNVEGAVKASFESGQKARQGLEAARGELEKRVSVLVEAAEEAGQRGNKAVEAAKRSIEELKNKLGGVQESASRAAGDVQKNVEELQRKMEQQAQQISESSGVEKLRSEAERGAEGLELDPEKHKAVDPESVNKDGEGKLAQQHWQSEKDDPESGGVVSEAIKEFVDPALKESSVGREVREDEIGDGNEYLKNMNDLVLHDSYAPIDDSDDLGGKSD